MEARGIRLTMMATIVALAAPARALYLDDHKLLQLTGKFQTQVSIRADDPKAFTFPRVAAGNLIQNRHQMDLELYHDVLGWLPKAYGIRVPYLRALGYRLRIKPTYDGVTDYGPEKLRFENFPPNTTARASLRQFDHQKILHNAFPWNAYVDLGSGPVSFRIGRQDLSWGETDGFRLLDMIQPLDNRFGFVLVEDLDDRRIPLWMLRTTIDLPFLNVGPFSNNLFDGYWVPGSLDNQESPPAPQASPFSINGLPDPKSLSATVDIDKPNKDFDSSRGGARLITSIAGRVTIAFGHYYSFQDSPHARVRVDPAGVNLADPECDLGGGTVGVAGCVVNATLEVNFYQQQVTGVSLTTAVPYDPLTILRAEAAMFWSERIEQASDLSLDSLTNLAIQAATTGEPATTDFRERNVVRWMIGLDRNVWIRLLNRNNTFFMTGQYFHSHILDPAKDNVFPLAHPRRSTFPRGGDIPTVVFDPRYQEEVLFTLAFFTYYWHGAVQPFPIFAYDPRGVWALVPGVNVYWGTNWVVQLKYANVLGHWHLLGFFKDRDVLFARIQYNLY